MGGCGTRSAQTVLAAFHLLAQAEGAAKGFKGQKQMNASAREKQCSARRMDIGLQSIFFNENELSAIMMDIRYI